MDREMSTDSATDSTLQNETTEQYSDSIDEMISRQGASGEASVEVDTNEDDINDDASNGEPAQEQRQVAMTDEQLERLIQAATAAKQPTPTKQEQEFLTPEEYAQHFRKFVANEQQIAQLLSGGPEAVKAFNEMLEAVYEHVHRVAIWRAQDQVNRFQNEHFSKLSERIDKEFAPVLQHTMQAEFERVGNLGKEAFYSANPELKPYRAMVDRVLPEITNEIKAGSLKISNREALFKEISNRTRKELKELNISVQTTPKRNVSNNGAPATPSKRPTKTLSQGSGASVGGNSGSTSQRDLMEAFVASAGR